MNKMDMPFTSIDVAERLAFITEELHDIVKEIRGEQLIDEAEPSFQAVEGKERSIGNTIDIRLFRLFVFFGIRNLTRGSLAGISYKSGKNIGLSFPVFNVKELEELIHSLNLGILKIAELNEQSVRIELHECATSFGMLNTNKSVCYFEAGLLAGALERIIKRRINLYETKCYCNGDDCCEFSLYIPPDFGRIKTIEPIKPVDTFSQENIQLLATLAQHSIAAIENATLFERTKQLISIDGLTQIFNHRFFQERIRIELKRAKRHNLNLSMIMMDLDNFKEYNDKFGHPKGDEVLKKIAELILENLREIDTVARYGGDEFAIILPHTDSDSTFIVAKRIKEKLDSMLFDGIDENQKVKITMSMGIASYPNDCDNAETLIELADKALLSIKKNGKGEINKA